MLRCNIVIVKEYKVMVLFGFIFFVSVLALLVVRELDIECERPARPRTMKPLRSEQRSAFPADTMGLRQF
jgi:hypothetical protein